MLTIDAKTNYLFWNGCPVLLPRRCYSLTETIKSTGKGRPRARKQLKLTITDDNLLTSLKTIEQKFAKFGSRREKHYPFIHGNLLVTNRNLSLERNDVLILGFQFRVFGYQIHPTEFDASAYVQTLLLLRELDLVADIQDEIFLKWCLLCWC